MLDHLAIQVTSLSRSPRSLQVTDVDAATAWFLRLLGPIGVREVMSYDVPGGRVVGLAGPDGFPHFWLGPTSLAPGREVHGIRSGR